MLIVVWLTSTALATGMAFVAVSLVLAGVSGQRAEQLRFGATAIYEPAAMSAPIGSTTTIVGKRPARSSTTLRNGAHAATTDPPVGATGSGPAAPTPSPPVDGGVGSAAATPEPSPTAPRAQAQQAPPATTAAPRAGSTTFSTAGGVVTVSCTGTSARLVSASPASGYTMDVHESGPESVAVSFESGDHDSEISARCVDGRPQLEHD